MVGIKLVIYNNLGLAQRRPDDKATVGAWRHLVLLFLPYGWWLDGWMVGWLVFGWLVFGCCQQGEVGQGLLPVQ